MASTTPSTRNYPRFELNYLTLRSVVSPEDQEAGRKRYCGIARANALFDLDWDEDVRKYLGRDEEGNKRKSTMVNRAIRDTIAENPDLFPLRNTGVVIVARDVKVDDQARRAVLQGAGIINGAQTSGVLKEYFGQNRAIESYPSVNFELIITDDEELIADISISRNYQNRVDDLSIYGRKGRFEELEASLRRHDKNIRLRTSETDFSPEFLDTEKLIQVLTALMPRTVPVPSADRRREGTPESIYRIYAYRHRSRCLKDFATVMDKTAFWKQAYSFFLDVAWDGWQQYLKLKGEQSFSGLHHVKGEENGGKKIVSSDGVPDGIVFPMLSALSRLVTEERGHWRYAVPEGFPWPTLFENAEEQFKSTGNHNPNTMGKHAGCYIALHGLFDMFFAGAGHSTRRR